MKVREIIDGLKDLIKDRESFIDQDEPDNVFGHDKDVLNAAIDALSAAPENEALKEQLAIKSEQLESLRTIFYEVTGSVPSRRPEKQTDICAKCVHDESEYKNTAQSATNTRAEKETTNNLKVPQNEEFVKQNIVAYKGIGPEKGKTVSADDALPYAMLRCGITFVYSENIGDCRQEFMKTLVDWFYSGNWLPYKSENGGIRNV
ncbi:protein of unknown function [Ruminococcaceae bacterium BL-4]|nr:protein of unknown function [Ruminococcaceae bacterium BL-4]